MRKKLSIEKLSLKKEALSLLNKGQLNTIIGGAELSQSCNEDEKHMPTSPVICK